MVPRFRFCVFGSTFSDIRIKYPSLPSPHPLSAGDFEDMYSQDPRAAFEWQEHYNDDGDNESDLLSLLHLLRQSVRKDVA